MTSDPFGMHGMSKNATSVRKRQVAFFTFSAKNFPFSQFVLFVPSLSF